MPIGSLLLIAALSLLVLFYLALPFFKESGLGENVDQKRSSLLAERERILAAILELEADNQLGKVPTSIFQEQRQGLLEKGARVLAQLEGKPESATSTRALEKIIANHRNKEQ